MAYNENLAQKVQELMNDLPGFNAKKMFGGVGFMLQGNMACGVNKDDLVVRVGPQRYDEAMSKPFTRLFDITGRPMKGWVMVDPKGFASDDDLKYWVQLGVDFALSLPPK